MKQDFICQLKQRKEDAAFEKNERRKREETLASQAVSLIVESVGDYR